ncbi:MAG: hypothetical protein K2I03_01995, partial [Lachnospiraceae bacterium]|nr:hypothetical protein [Lachnospiraceae bacterium]
NKKIKNYFAVKKQIRELSLDTLQKINGIASTLSDLTDIAASAAETLNSDKLEEFMENMNKIVDNPELTTAYYQQVSRQAHKQKMADI